MATKVIVDVDTGVDDAIAILTLLADSEIELLSVTTVTGNIDCVQAAKNTKLMLTKGGSPDVPISTGATKSRSGRKAASAHHVHGSDGLGEIADKYWGTVSETPVFPGNATETLVAAAEKYGPELTIVATGPLTNIANAVLADPVAMSSIRSLFVMGGGFRNGNVTPYAEFNANFDPIAFSTVLHSEMNITLFPLDVTEQVVITRDDITTNLSGDLQQLIVEMTGKYIEFHQKAVGINGFFVHDALPIIALSRPALFQFEAANVYVVTHPENSSYCGQTLRFLPQSDAKETRLAMNCDVRAIKQRIWSLLNTL